MYVDEKHNLSVRISVSNRTKSILNLFYELFSQIGIRLRILKFSYCIIGYQIQGFTVD